MNKAAEMATRLMPVKHNSPFADDHNKEPIRNVNEASAELAEARKIMKCARVLIQQFPGLVAEYEERFKAIDAKYDHVAQLIGAEKERYWLTDFHKAHPDEIFFSHQPVSSSEGNPTFKSRFTAGEALALTWYRPAVGEGACDDGNYRPAKELNLKFYVGGYLLGELQTDSRFGKGGGKASLGAPVLSMPLWGQNLDQTLDQTVVKLYLLRKLFTNIGRLNPEVHKVDVKVGLDGWEGSCRNVSFELDCTGNAGDNYFKRMAKSLESRHPGKEEDEFIAKLKFKNMFPSSSVRSKVEAAILKSCEGKAKRVKVYFEEKYWTVESGMGGNKGRFLYYSYVLEDREGNCYVGRNNVYQRGFTNGNFESVYRPAAFIYFREKGKWGNSTVATCR